MCYWNMRETRNKGIKIKSNEDDSSNCVSVGGDDVTTDEDIESLPSPSSGRISFKVISNKFLLKYDD